MSWQQDVENLAAAFALQRGIPLKYGSGWDGPVTGPYLARNSVAVNGDKVFAKVGDQSWGDGNHAYWLDIEPVCVGTLPEPVEPLLPEMALNGVCLESSNPSVDAFNTIARAYHSEAVTFREKLIRELMAMNGK